MFIPDMWMRTNLDHITLEGCTAQRAFPRPSCREGQGEGTIVYLQNQQGSETNMNLGPVVSIFLMLWPFNILPQVAGTPSHRTIFFLLLPNYNECYCYDSDCKYLICDPSERVTGLEIVLLGTEWSSFVFRRKKQSTWVVSRDIHMNLPLNEMRWHWTNEMVKWARMLATKIFSTEWNPWDPRGTWGESTPTNIFCHPHFHPGSHTPRHTTHPEHTSIWKCG